MTDEFGIEILTLSKSLARDYKEGKITLRQAAESLHDAGWFPFIPSEEKTIETLNL